MITALLKFAALTVATAFGVGQRDGKWWFIDPNGKPFWSFGVDCVGPGESEKEYDPKNPGYAAYRIYPSPDAWGKGTFQNLRKWGFNSLGGWSDVDQIKKHAISSRLPYFEVLHLGAYARAPFEDIFTDAARAAMRNAARDQILKLRSDPMLVGYFSDNELGWWGDTLFTSYLAMPHAATGKQRIMATIRKYYSSDFEKFERDWITKATDFEGVDRIGHLKLRPNGQGMQCINAWLFAMGSYYYKLVHDAIRDYDAQRLILGDRYCQFFELPIAEASKPYIDVCSTNFGATWNDGTFAHFFLDTLHRVTEKPVVITEFYMGATENRSGNKNVPPAFPLVDTQKQRAKSFLTNVQGFAALPYVVGAHWFQYYDEPPKGRGDGENFNHGLVDTKGRPYDEMVAAAASSHPEKIHRHSLEGSTKESLNVPLAPFHALEGLKPWPRSTGFVPPSRGTPFADEYVCRDSKNLYVGVIAMDYMDEGLYEGDRIPSSERSCWTIKVSGFKNPIEVKFGGKGQRPTVSNPDVKVSELPGLQHSVMIAVPLELVEPSDRLVLDSTLLSHGRSHVMDWHEILTVPRTTGVVDHLAKGGDLSGVVRTRFTIIEDQGVSWFVRPDGRKFLSMGVCCVDQGANSQTFDPKNPGYAAYLYYPTAEMWAKDTLNRLKFWGFNTVGAWSDTRQLLKPNQPDMVFTPILHMGSSAGAPWKDMWDPKIVSIMDQIARDQILPLRTDPRILGYFSDNEMGWWNGAMFDWAFKAGSASRSHLVALLSRAYHGKWSKVLSDFETVGASSLLDLKTKGRLYLRPGSHGIETIHQWMRLVSDRYYSLCRTIIKKYDPGALYLGDRYISNFYPEVAESAGKYCDVVSTNLNADTNLGDFAPFYLPALRSVTNRPILITEYYEAAKENRTGNKNDSSGFPVASTQKERAAAFLFQTYFLINTPYVVGAHWFQYYDEPPMGRGDGENYDMGLVDNLNRPYDEMVSVPKLLGNHLHRRYHYIYRAPNLFKPDTKKIDSFLTPFCMTSSDGSNLRGDLFVRDSGKDLQVAVHWNEDLFPEALYRTGKVSSIDSPELKVTVGGKTSCVRMEGDGVPKITNGIVMSYKFGVRNYVIFTIPRPAFPLRLDATMTTRSRAYRMAWTKYFSAAGPH